MEITVAQERIFRLDAKLDQATARGRVGEKRVNLVAGTMGALWSRPKPEDIRLVYEEMRLEPAWQFTVHARTVYDRECTYTVPVGGGDVRQVTVGEQILPVRAQAKGGPAILLKATEHCEEEVQKSLCYGGDGVARAELAALLAGSKAEIEEVAGLAADGIIVVPPAVKPNIIIRQIVSQLVRPVNAQVIHEESLHVETVDLYFRPVYAFEFEWAAKSKQVVVECDGITGEMRTGKAFKEQIKAVLNSELLFDLGVDAAELVVPGAAIAAKLVRAVVRKGK